jgi:RNA polymerase sigma factor (TIGR02999 family)
MPESYVPAAAFEAKRNSMEITTLLQRVGEGDQDALNVVIPLVYAELKKLARAHLRREARPIPLETTGLVHEAFLKLAGGRHPSYESRSHFYGIASRLMRQVLVDTARATTAEKRGPGQEVAVADLPDWAPQPNRPLLAMEEALERLERTDPLKGQLIEMRYFGGMTAEETSLALSLPLHIVRRELRLGQAWLRRDMASEPARSVAPPVRCPEYRRQSHPRRETGVNPCVPV